MDPELMQQFLQMLLGTSGGDDLDHQKDAYNWLQDQNDLMADPMAAMYGGAGTVDPYAFQDQVVDQQEFDVPQNPLQPYLSLDPSSEEGFIATAIAAGKSPSEALKLLTDKNDLYKNDPDANKRARELASNLFSGYSQYDQQMSTLPDMQRDETGNWNYQGQGQIVGGKLQVPVMGASKAARRFTDLGLPTPVDQFSEADFGFDGQRESDNAQLAAMRARVAGDPNVSQAGQIMNDQRAYDNAAVAPFTKALNERDIYLDDQEMPEFGRTTVSLGYNGMPVSGPVAYSQNQPRRFNEKYDLDALAADGPLSEKTPLAERKALTEGAMRAMNGQAGAPAQARYGELRKERSTALRGMDNLAHSENFDRLYAQKMAEKHAQAGITPLSLVAMQRALAMRQRGA